ncbi:DNA double-strand break repair nuclease NurA [Pasteuria penetrans]|uniref:DNA double-strand break repair nuclease NurA n=1 Tax=Pasteuria penetrans TaxID=86005 RepID=UPI000F98CFBB|nr:DNA double-strand break repair nuclease NurA [Pasteuria penetrans]
MSFRPSVSPFTEDFSSPPSLSNQLREINQYLLQEQKRVRMADIRVRLQEMGGLFPLVRISSPVYREWFQDRGLVAVDGSFNTIPSSSNKKIFLFQALSKFTKGGEIWRREVVMKGMEEGDEDFNPSSYMLDMELQVARESVHKWAPRVVMMDGTLLYFHRHAKQATASLCRMAEERQTYLLGVGEEIASQQLAQLWPDLGCFEDRVLLYGALRQGEAWRFPYSDRCNDLFWRTAVRLSSHPQPVVVDGLRGQEEERGFLLNFLQNSTPEQGRGIPYWLDIVDYRVRLTHCFLKMLAHSFLDPDVCRRFLYPKRADRFL